ncbi:MAG: non-canonical purine NTP pyrophosphatase, partial [Flavobacteriales bacterium]|nr:non-canonical purine NTP pyrophosphatase [Flavobacteriales bacterium]
FVPEGYTDTFAQMPSAQKNSMSHRSRAVEILQEELLKPE